MKSSDPLDEAPEPGAERHAEVTARPLVLGLFAVACSARRRSRRSVNRAAAAVAAVRHADLAPGQRLGSIAFVGPGHHELLAATEDSVAIIVAPGRVATPWIKLSSAPAQGHGWRWISSSLWAWNDASAELVGLVAAYGTGVVEPGLASWWPMRAQLPRLLVPISDRIAPASLQTFAISPDTRFAVGGNVDPVVLDLMAGRQVGGPLATSYAGSAAFSARRVAIGVDSGVVVMSLARGTTTKLESGDERIDALAFHPKRPVLVGATALGRVLEWHEGEPEPHALAYEAKGLAFSPDGKLLALVGESKLVLLDATTLRAIGAPIELPLSYFDNEPIPIAFSPP